MGLSGKQPVEKMTSAQVTSSLGYLLLYFSAAVALGTALALGVSTASSGYGQLGLFYAICGFIVALVSSTIVGLCVLVLFSPLIYRLGRRLSAKLTWRGRIAAYFGFAVLAATIIVVGGLPIAPIIGGEPAEWDPRAFFASPVNPLFAAAIILIAGLSAAAACMTIRRSSIRAIRQAKTVVVDHAHSSVGSAEERP